MSSRLIATLTLALPLLIGCGRNGPATYPIAGVVRFEGQPVAEGDILFVPEDASLAPEGGKIVDGKFRMESKAGICRVKISALEIGPDTEWAMGSPIASNYIPPCYNEETTLTADVAAGGNNEFTFNLTKPE